MRLICPNCEAQYEVEASAIPAEGRDVQCSACGHVWSQLPVTAEVPPEAGPSPQSPDGVSLQPPEPAPSSVPPRESGARPEPSNGVPAQAPEPEPPQQSLPEPPLVPVDDSSAASLAPLAMAQARPEGLAPPRRPLDEKVMAVLREEALREALQRRTEAARGPDPRPEPRDLSGAARRQPLAAPPVAPGVELPPPAKPDPVLPDAGEPPAEFQAAEPHRPEIAVAPLDPPIPAPPPLSREGAGAAVLPAENLAPPRRDLLPDVEQINSTLAAEFGDARFGRSTGARRGFLTGFLLILALFLIAGLVYAMAPRIAAQLPSAAPAMGAYVAEVDDLRRRLDGAVDDAVAFGRATLNGIE